MTVAYLGGLSIAQAVPGAATAATSGQAGINAALPDITARLTALLSFVPTPVSFAAQLQLAQDTVASVQAAITLGLPVPDISTQIAEVAALVAGLTAQVAAVNAQLGVITSFQTLLATGGIHGYAFTGSVENLGSELTTDVTQTGAGNALVLLTTSPTAWAAMSQVFTVTP